MRQNGGFALLVVVGAIVAPRIAVAGDGDAKSERFETIAEGAVRIERDALAGLVWSLTASCDQGDALAQRQCRAIKVARAGRFGSKRFLVHGDAAAFTVGAFDAKKSSAPVAVSGCIACVEPVAVGEHAFYIVAKKAPPTFDGAVARAALLHESARTFKDDAASVQWRTSVVPRLITELVVEIPENAAWKKDGKDGLAVEIVGFRVFDPCDGEIVVASPKSERAGVDKAACGESVAEGEATGGAGVAAKKPSRAKDTTPDELSAAQIKATMQPVRDAANACFEQLGVAGDAKLHVTVGASGAVIAVDIKGDLAGTPTAACIDQAVKAVTFPRTRKARQSFNYPIILR